MDTNHHFTGTQQADYDSLRASGRTAYDEARWYNGADHETAFRAALAAHGLKKTITSPDTDVMSQFDSKRPMSW